jgi:hypothetical protein
VTRPFRPKQPIHFRPFISERMAQIAFTLYKRILKPYSPASALPSASSRRPLPLHIPFPLLASLSPLHSPPPNPHPTYRDPPPPRRRPEAGGDGPRARRHAAPHRCGKSPFSLAPRPPPLRRRRRTDLRVRLPPVSLSPVRSGEPPFVLRTHAHVIVPSSQLRADGCRQSASRAYTVDPTYCRATHACSSITYGHRGPRPFSPACSTAHVTLLCLR